MSEATPAAEEVHEQASSAAHGKGKPLALALAALGIVYGDIGTSPLYALRECFYGTHFKLEVTQGNVLGILSLVFWSLTMVIAVKYIAFIMKADNHGEGGMFALLALVPPGGSKVRGAVVLAALFGASLLYGEGLLTPAISVLSAIEGLEVATSKSAPLVVPLTCAILFGLFMVQRHGTAGIGQVFGPIMLVWFFSISLLGGWYIVRNPSVLAGLNPLYAVRFFLEHKGHAFVVLGSVVLCITGGEALYADMGHFGRGPIKVSWFALVFPALLLNYFGQGAHILERPEATNPFFAMVPSMLLYPMVALAAAAAVIASQALISGAFSLTRQAVQLGYCPRVTVVHTSGENEGQIYIPEVNTILMVACLGLVLTVRDSSKLAAAYGIAVTGTMSITSIVYFVVATRTWKWPLWKAGLPVLLFLSFDLTYFASNLLKFFEGGWFPIVVAAGIFCILTTWKVGRSELARRVAESTMPLTMFLEDIERRKPHRVAGTAVFMFSNPDGVPPVLLHHLKHNQVLHSQVVLLSVIALDQPSVPTAERLKLEDLDHGFFRVRAHYGFMETPNVPDILQRCRKLGLKSSATSTSYYLGRETLLFGGSGRMWRWRKALFAFLSRNARPATYYFGIPPGRVVELGMQIDL
jgi:KUP system potassium uptake protein